MQTFDNNIIFVLYCFSDCLQPLEKYGKYRLSYTIMLWEQEVASSNLATPTAENQPLTSKIVGGFFVSFKPYSNKYPI